MNNSNSIYNNEYIYEEPQPMYATIEPEPEPVEHEPVEQVYEEPQPMYATIENVSSSNNMDPTTPYNSRSFESLGIPINRNNIKLMYDRGSSAIRTRRRRRLPPSIGTIHHNRPPIRKSGTSARTTYGQNQSRHLL